MDMAQGKREALTADDWTGAGLEALARGGLAAVAVEPLAKALGTTKGSFYWHFADRNGLIAAALARWEQPDTELGCVGVESEGGAPARLRSLLHLAFPCVELGAAAGGGSVELAPQASAADPLVAPVPHRVSERRLPYLNGLFTEIGLS